MVVGERLLLGKRVSREERVKCVRNDSPSFLSCRYVSGNNPNSLFFSNANAQLWKYLFAASPTCGFPALFTTPTNSSINSLLATCCRK